mgnify:CR=1 FL=1
MIKLLYTVAEISEMLGFSKVTIYNKINSLKSGLKGCISRKKGITYINSKGLLIIRESLGLKVDEDTLINDDDIKATSTEDNEDIKQFKDINYLIETIKETIETGQENYINSLLDQIELLKSELNNKDDQLNNTLRLLENSQILLRDSKEKILELESMEQAENEKLMKYIAENKKEEKRKNIFEKIFSR